MWHYGTIAVVVLTVLAFIYWRSERKTKRIVDLTIENNALRTDNQTLKNIIRDWEDIDAKRKKEEADDKNLSPARRLDSIRGL